jgi:hypothetical protein
VAIKWHEEARKMRSEGGKLSDIALALGVSAERVRQVCLDVVCPVDHKAFFRDPEWRAQHSQKPERRMEREAFIRAHYKNDLSATEIGYRLGISRNAVIGSARDLGLCTPSIPQPKQATPHLG